MSTTGKLLNVRVARKTAEAEGIAGFELTALDGGALPAFDAGAHLDVHLPDGLVRQYSLCNGPAQSGCYAICVLEDPAGRGGSRAMHRNVHQGDTLTISAPRNHFPLFTNAARSLLFAGGIGITPIIAMAERLAGDGAAFELHYSSRSAARTAFAERLRTAPYAGQVRFHTDDGDAVQRLDLRAELAMPAPGTHLYVCGPKGFMDAVLATARDAGWSESQLHCEYFAGAVSDTAHDLHFEVEIRSSGKVIRVEAAQTVVQALAAEGIVLPTSCEQGVCGTCLTRVLSGDIEHRDMYLMPEEQAQQDQFLPCCSRAKSGRLVLDL